MIKSEICVQEGENLICQNCRNSFTMSDVEVNVGGCNPVPIFKENKTVAEETITVTNYFLTESSVIFENWKI